MFYYSTPYSPPRIEKWDERYYEQDSDSERSEMLLGIDDSSDSEDDVPVSPGTPRLSPRDSPKARGVTRATPQKNIQKSPRGQGADTATSTAKAVKSKNKPVMVEVFSKHTKRWELGHTAKRKVLGRTVVKFEIDGMPHVKSLPPNSSHLRRPEGVQRECSQYVWQTSPAAITDDVAKEDDVEGKIRRHDTMAQVELRNVVVADKSSKVVPVCEALEWRWVSLGAFASRSHITWNGFWEVRYVGSPDEDVVLRVFKGVHQKDYARYEFVGFIHAMQFGHRGVHMPESSEEYYVGIEIHTNLNRSIFQSMTLNEQRRHMHKMSEMMLMDRPYAHSAEKSDFVVCLSEDIPLNNMMMWRLQHFGVTSGPWGDEKRGISISTDGSLGLGLHFGNKVNLCLGGTRFGRACSINEWFVEFAEAVSKARYGLLMLDGRSTNFYQSAPGWINIRRQYFYYQQADSIVSRREHDNYMLRSAPALSLVAEQGKTTEAKEVLQQDTQTIHVEDERQRHPLHYAALRGHVVVVSQLLSSGADVESWSTAGNTPLHLASLSGHEAIAGLLLRAGADVGNKNFEGRTPLHLAALNGQAWMAELLLSAGADMQCQDQNGETPLDFAMNPGGDIPRHYGHSQVTTLLQKAGAERGHAIRAAWDLANATGGHDEDVLADALDSAKNAGVGDLLVGAAELKIRQATCRANLLASLNKKKKFLSNYQEIVRDLESACKEAKEAGLEAELISCGEIELKKLTSEHDMVEAARKEDLLALRDALAEAREAGANPEAIVKGEDAEIQIVLLRKLEHAMKKQNRAVLEKVLEEVRNEGVKPRNFQAAIAAVRRMKALQHLQTNFAQTDASPGDDVQDGSLQKAVAEAKAAGVDPKDLEPFQLRVDVYNSEKALKDALESQDDHALRRALALGKKAGANEQLLSTALQKLPELTATRRLVDASRGEDAPALQTAIEDAKDAGVDAEALRKAEAQFQKLAVAKKLMTASSADELKQLLASARSLGVAAEKISIAEQRLTRVAALEEVKDASQKKDAEGLRQALKAARTAGADPATVGEGLEALKRIEAEQQLSKAIKEGNAELISRTLITARESGAGLSLVEEAVIELKKLRCAESLAAAAKCQDVAVMQNAIKDAEEAGVGAEALQQANAGLNNVIATEGLQTAMLSGKLSALADALDAAAKARVAPTAIEAAHKLLRQTEVQKELDKAIKSEDVASLKRLILDGQKIGAPPSILAPARKLLRDIGSEASEPEK